MLFINNENNSTFTQSLDVDAMTKQDLKNEVKKSRKKQAESQTIKKKLEDLSNRSKGNASIPEAGTETPVNLFNVKLVGASDGTI